MKAVTKRLLATILSLCSAICVYCGLTLSAKTVHAATDFNITGVSAYNVNDDRFYVVLSTDVEIQSAGQQRITVSVEKAGVTEEIAVTFNAFSNADIQIPTSAVAKTGEKGFVTIPKGTTAGEFVLATDYTFFVGEEIASGNIYAMETDRLDTVQMTASYARYRMFFNEYAADGATDNDYYANNEAYKILNFKEDNETSTALGIVRYGVHEGKLYLRADTDDLAGVTSAAQVPEMVIYVPKGAILCPNNGNYRAIIGRDIYIHINGETIEEVFRTEPVIETEKSITLENAKIKMGGDYSGAYYAFDGSWENAGWFVNAVETTGDIYVKYNIETETRTAGGTYGATRLINANTAAHYAVTHGIVDFVHNGSANTWKDVANGNEILLYYNATTHRRTLNGSIVWGYPQTETAGIEDNGGGNGGVTTGYETADSLGAKWFGVAWGGGTYALKANVQIYDGNNNDLGVLWSATGSNVSSELVGKIGKTVYFVSAFDNVDTVTVKTASNVEIGVTKGENGIYSFTMPAEAVTISTTEKTVTSETLSFKTLVNQGSRFIMLLNGGTGNGEHGSEICDVIVKTDGEEKTAKLWNWGEDLAIYISYDVLPATGYHTLEIAAQTLTEKYSFAGVSLSVFDGSVVTPVTLERNGGQYQANAEADIYRYVVYFNDFGGEFRYIGNVSITVNDATSAVAELYQWSDGKSAVLLNSSDYPTDTEFKITITPCTVGDFYITNSVSFYIGNEEVYDKTEVIYTINGGRVVKEVVWGEANFNTVFAASSIETSGVKVIGYTYGEALYASLTDIYEKVTAETEGTPKKVEFAVETVEISNEAGAYIRTNSDYQGLRFTTKIAETKHAAITEYGMYFTSLAFYKSSDLGGDFTKISDGVNGYKISSAKEGFNSWIKGDGYEYFSSVIDLSGVNYNRDFTVCAYVVISYADGTSKTILARYDAGDSVRSAYEVASAAISHIEDKTSSAYVYTQKYVDGVLDIDYDYNLIGAERSYTIEKLADGQIRLVAKEGSGFDVTTVLAFAINGVKQTATFSDGVATFDASLLTAGRVQNEIAESGRSGRKMQILAYDGPSLGIHLSEGVLTNDKYRSSVTADIKKYFDAGFNYLVADEADYGAYRYEGIQYGSGISGTKNDAERMLDLVALYCDEYGITDREQAPVIIYWSFIFAIMDKEERQNLMLNGEVRSDDNVKFLLKNAYDELRAYVPAYPEGYTAKTNGTPLNCFKGFVLRDEPFGEDLELYVKWYNYLADDMGMTENGDLLVGSVLTFGVAEKYAISGSTSENVVSDEDFRTNYLEKVVSGMASNSADKGKQYVMTDPYPFYTTLKKSSWSSGVTASYYISDSYFTTLEEYAEKAKEQGLKAGVALQSTTHYNKSRFEAVGSAGFFSSAECRVTGRVDKSGNLTANENHIRYQAYMAMCYGYERIDYFTYWEHFNSIAAETMRQSAVMWSYDQASGEYVAAYQPTYDWIKKANAEIRGFESVILAFDRQGTRLVTGTVASGNCFGNAKGYSGDAIANTATASYDLAVGCFGLSEMKGYMLVNADDPSYARTNAVSIDFGTDYAYAVCYVNGMAEVKALNAGKLDISLGSGDGVFAIPVK